MSAFPADPDWLVFHPAPSRPVFKVPPGAVDAHCHVFGPGNVFPYAPERKYTPCDAPKDKLWALQDHLGFSRCVIVQATCHGVDNSALVDALKSSGGRARGVAAVRSDVSDEELHVLHDAGIRGVRFNFVKRLSQAPPLQSLEKIAARIAGLGWHVEIYFEAADLPDLHDFLASFSIPLVVDHIGLPDVTKPIYGTEFEGFVRLLEANANIYTKVSCPERISISGPPHYDDVTPFARRIVETFPDRVLWGADWPHPNMKVHMPDDGDLVDIIPKIAVTSQLQLKLLVDNPMRLYWPELATKPNSQDAAASP